LAELEGLHKCLAGVEAECVVQSEQLSRLLMEISDALASLGLSPIQDIPVDSASA
jgi:hypothetical protein